MTNRILVSGAIGAGLLSLLTVLFFVLFAPSAFRDGQFGLVFAFTLPFGALIGAVTGGTLSRLSQPAVAGRTSLLGGLLISVLAMLLAWSSASSRGGRSGDFLISLVAPWMGAAFLWGLALVLWGLW